MKLTAVGRVVGTLDPFVGRIALEAVSDERARGESILVRREVSATDDFRGYRGLITSTPVDQVPRSGVPAVAAVADIDHLRTDQVVLVNPKTGVVRTLYRPDSRFNSLFVTERCNSNCLMCSQPPKDADDSWRLRDCAEVVRLIKDPPETLGITGGEPTLLGSDLFSLLKLIGQALPGTSVHMLTNGRRFSNAEFAREFAASAPPLLSLGIPLYSASAQTHDYVVQSAGAFDQTAYGLHQLARLGVRVEIRVVLHAQTIPELRLLSEFIWRNFPFASHVALMGLEMMGYTKKNLRLLWVDPADYQSQLREAVEYLTIRGMSVSIYNHQLCVLDRSLWPFSRQSISDWKNVYLEECAKCSIRDRCGGLFKSGERQHSRLIKAISPELDVLEV